MSLSERKKQIIMDIASSYSNQIISKNQSKSVVATSFITAVQSNQDADLCESCMLTYLTQDDIDKAFKHNSNSDIYLALFNQIGKGVCGGLCYINIKDIEQNNLLMYDIGSTIDSKDINIQKIIDYVKSETQKRYGYTDTSNSFDKSITDIINNVQAQTSINIKQNISALQSIHVDGSGQVTGVTQNLVINAIMNAIVTSSDSVNLIDKMVQEQMDFIKKEVDKNVIGDFTYVWEESKWYIIGCGIFLLSLLIITIFLLMYKAAK